MTQLAFCENPIFDQIFDFYKEIPIGLNFHECLKSRFFRFRGAHISAVDEVFRALRKAASRYDPDLLSCQKLEILAKTRST